MRVNTQIKSMIALLTLASSLHSPATERESWEYLMDSDKPKSAAEQKAWDLLKECRHQGGEGARRLIAEMPRIPYKYRNQALEVLSLTQTKEAQQFLVSQALSCSDTYAAIVYLENSGEASAARNLLNSANREIQAIALRGLLSAYTKGLTERRGDYSIPLDRRAWEVVTNQLMSQNLEWRLQATLVVSESGGTEVTMEEKVRALAASMATTLAVPEARKQNTAGGFAWSYPCPFGEDVLAEQGLRLSRMKGVTHDLLAALTRPGPGLVHEAMIIARFIGGEQAMRGDLHQILTNSASGRMRMAALDGLFRTATEADRACLEQVAASDPLEGKPGLEQTHLNENVIREGKGDAKFYPARIQAEWCLKALDARKNQPAQLPR